MIKRYAVRLAFKRVMRLVVQALQQLRAEALGVSVEKFRRIQRNRTPEEKAKVRACGFECKFGWIRVKSLFTSHDAPP